MVFTRRCFAKVNLFLGITGKRTDGYHEIASVFQTLSLFDTLTVSISDHFSLEISGQIPGNQNDTFAGLTTDNILEKVYRYFEKHFQITPVEIKLDKRIPVGAGLGGGSSNAASLIQLLDDAFDLKLSLEKKMEIAALFGSDVPFFILGGLAKVTGRGEKVLPMNFFPKFFYVLIHPGISISTAVAYRELVSFEEDADQQFGHFLETFHQSSGKVDQAFVAQLGKLTLNGFQKKAVAAFSEVARALTALSQYTPFTLLSGSGSVVFGVFADALSAERAKEQIIKDFPWTVLATGLPAGVDA